MIRFRRATAEDIDAIMPVYERARKFMRMTGNLHQWAGDYPSRENISADISSGVCYLGEDEDAEIAVVFAFITGDDPTYKEIYDGNWLNDSPYGTIHRIASSGRHGGMLALCVDFCLSMTDNLRLDTHADNRPMQAAAERLGFVRCGTIICSDGTPRTAYHKIKGGNKV